MILKLLLFTTTLIVRSESLWRKVTSKPSLPSNLQELLDSLYITGYMPEYIIPENELIETEKTEGEYLDFPDFKNVEENVFVPPESEYLKNDAHLKKIKGHKRLVPHIATNSKKTKITEKLRNPNIGPDELRLDLNAHLTENFTGRQLAQHDSAKLDFLIPIPEKGTYPPHPAPNLYNIPLTESTMYYFPTPDSIGKMWEMELMKSSVQNHTAFPPLPGGTIMDNPPRSYLIKQQPKPFTTALYPLKPQFLGSPQQPLAVFQSQKPLFGCTAPQQQFPFNVKQPGSHTIQYQPAENIKQSNHNSRVQQLQSILMGHESQPAPLFFKTNRTISRPILLSVNQPQIAPESPTSKVVNNRIQTKVVSLSLNSSVSGNPQMMLINPNYSAVQTNISLDYGTTANIDSKLISQTNSSINSYAVSVVEHPPPTKQKKKMFTFFNIFKKNKQNPLPEEHAHNASLKGKRENGAISLAELYNRLTDSNAMNENSRMEKEYPIKQVVEEPEIYHKRKKRKK